MFLVSTVSREGLQPLIWLARSGFRLDVAGRRFTAEPEPSLREGFAALFAFKHEDGVNQVVHAQGVFAHQSACEIITTQATRAVGGEGGKRVLHG